MVFWMVVKTVLVIGVHWSILSVSTRWIQWHRDCKTLIINHLGRTCWEQGLVQGTSNKYDKLVALKCTGRSTFGAGAAKTLVTEEASAFFSETRNRMPL